jgi:hypothetical protein
MLEQLYQLERDLRRRMLRPSYWAIGAAVWPEVAMLRWPHGEPVVYAAQWQEQDTLFGSPIEIDFGNPDRLELIPV